MAKRANSKTNMAISIDAGLAYRLRELAEIEGCSISSLVQKCVREYLPAIHSGLLQDDNTYRLDLLFSRITSAVTTSDMRKCGVRPICINFEPSGIKIELAQLRDADGVPIPLELNDVFGPPREEGESNADHTKRADEYFRERLAFWGKTRKNPRFARFADESQETKIEKDD